MHLELTASPIDENRRLDQEDIFEKDTLVGGARGPVREIGELDSPQDISADFDELPIELISLIDRFIESLGAKVHNTPPSIEKLSDIFQGFYVKAEAHITTHISALTTRQSRGGSPNPSISSKASSIAKDGKRLRSSSSKDTLPSLDGAGPEQQMLTPQEISDRRKARRLLDRKGVALEEAVERGVCERVYNRIWRHRSTLDEVRDEKLRSRTAALALVGIGLRDLGIDFETSQSEAKDMEIENWISKARDRLLRMNDAKHPLGKLQHLAAAHKNIVDLLMALHKSSSSADEILPTLIYTLITTPPEGINVISNLHFIQRFRAASKVDGEAAYCLVNLEAAITFLETVDLASLRSDEPLEGPPKSVSRPSTPHDDLRPEWLPGKPNSASMSPPSPTPVNVTSQPLTFDHPLQFPALPNPSGPNLPSHHRNISNLFQPPVSALGAAGDAVRTTADQGLKNIGNTLDNSFKLLFGRLKERKVAGDAADADGTIILPKTLDDARKLVEPKSEDEQDNTPSITPLADHSDEQISNRVKSDDNLLSAFAGRKQPRDRSIDSVQSSGSGKRVGFAAEKSTAASPSSTHHGNAAVESMLSIGNSLNPLKGFGGISIRGFGVRTSSGGPTSAPTPTLAAVEKAKEMREAPSVGQLTKITPPVRHFMDVERTEDLKIGDIAELLKDYKRLAGALRDLEAF